MLTKRQLEFLELYASGHRMAEIAEMKGLSPHTVRCTLKNTQMKLHAKTLTHAVALACRAELFGLEPKNF